MKIARHPLVLLSCFTGLLFAPSAGATDIRPDDRLVRYVGRFDDTNPDGPRVAWSAGTLAFTVSGGSVSVTLRDKGTNVWQVVIDGQPASVLTLQAGDKSYPVAENLPAGAHRIELVKRTEASVGVTQILGLRIDDAAKLLATPARPHRIEVIGDSISCGFGNEAASQQEKFTPATENGWLAYGAVAARAVNADYVCVAWSGKKLWPDNTIVDLYDRTLPFSAEPVWDFGRWIPDAVVVNLGTNDFSRETPAEDAWISAYLGFIKRIRENYPNAPIYCAVSPMMGDFKSERKPRTTIIAYLNTIVARANAAGGPPVRLIEFDMQKTENGFGASWHPSVKTHAIMGEKLAAALKQDLGW